MHDCKYTFNVENKMIKAGLKKTNYGHMRLSDQLTIFRDKPSCLIIVQSNLELFCYIGDLYDRLKIKRGL
jgi:hypothetical protein